MKTKFIPLFLSLGLALVLTLSGVPGVARVAHAQDATKLKIGYSTWVGYGPLFIARDKGYFKTTGLDAELIKIEHPKDRFAALADGQLNGLVTTLDTMPQYSQAETPFYILFTLYEVCDREVNVVMT